MSHREGKKGWPATIGWIVAGFAAYLAVALVVMLLGGGPLVVALVAGIAVFVGIVPMRRRVLPCETGGPRRHTGPNGALRSGLWLLAAWMGGQLLAVVVYAAFGSPGFDRVVEVQRDSPDALALVALVLGAPLAEETLLRGWAQPLLRDHLGPWPALLITTIGFSALHGNIVQFIATLPLGLLLGLVYERCRSLGPVVVLHAAFNALSVAVPPDRLLLVMGILLPVVVLGLVAVHRHALSRGLRSRTVGTS